MSGLKKKICRLSILISKFIDILRTLSYSLKVLLAVMESSISCLKFLGPLIERNQEGAVQETKDYFFHRFLV